MPGIKRDGTVFEGSFWVDGQWVRFQRGVPRSIGGYQAIATGFSGISRGVSQLARGGVILFHSGSANKLEQAQVSFGASAGVVDRTPAGFVADPMNVWQFELMWNAAAGSSNMALIAHAAPNLNCIDYSDQRKVWYGPVGGSTQLVDTGAAPVSGGVICLHPFLFTYDNDGGVAWSDANQPTVWSGTGTAAGSARVTEQKIVKGMVVRGGPGYSPSGLFWSLNSLVRASYIGGTAIFSFDTISDQTSILSSSAVIEYDGLYYWPGIDRFLVYNGIVREVPNNLNLNYFYENLNYGQAQKIWAAKVPRFGEIWWFYPRKPATECNDAIIHNVRENTWYDAGLAIGAHRSAGTYPQTVRYPLWMGNDAEKDGTYTLYQTERGVDRVERNNIANAIHSYIESCDISWCGQGPNQQWAGIQRNMRINRLELDFLQTAPMTLTIRGKAYAQGEVDAGDSFPYGPGTLNTSHIDMSAMTQRRQMRLNFDSNVQGGAWQMGTPLAHFGMGDERPTPEDPT